MLREIETCKGTILKHIPEAPQDPDAYRAFIAECLAHRFEVSPETARIRMDNEKISVS